MQGVNSSLKIEVHQTGAWRISGGDFFCTVLFLVVHFFLAHSFKRSLVSFLYFGAILKNSFPLRKWRFSFKENGLFKNGTPYI